MPIDDDAFIKSLQRQAADQSQAEATKAAAHNKVLEQQQLRRAAFEAAVPRLVKRIGEVVEKAKSVERYQTLTCAPVEPGGITVKFGSRTTSVRIEGELARCTIIVESTGGVKPGKSMYPFGSFHHDEDHWRNGDESLSNTQIAHTAVMFVTGV